MRLIFLLLLFLCTAYAPLDPKEAQWVAEKIFHNECSSNVEKLAWWNEGEAFPSLGIGHFIWYPEGQSGPFVETFPKLLKSLEVQGVKLPKWLHNAKGCPWKSKTEFAQASKQKQQLKILLSQTLAEQSVFIQQQFLESLPELLVGQTESDATLLQKKIDALYQTKQGRYALIDYLHFKGKGTAESERYAGQGWGLLQVLEAMKLEEENGAVAAFVQAAEVVLRRRVTNAPTERQEQRWLTGWLSRVQAYQ